MLRVHRHRIVGDDRLPLLLRPATLLLDLVHHDEGGPDQRFQMMRIGQLVQVQRRRLAMEAQQQLRQRALARTTIAHPPRRLLVDIRQKRQRALLLDQRAHLKVRQRRGQIAPEQAGRRNRHGHEVLTVPHTRRCLDLVGQPVLAVRRLQPAALRGDVKIAVQQREHRMTGIFHAHRTLLVQQPGQRLPAIAGATARQLVRKEAVHPVRRPGMPSFSLISSQ